MWQSLIGTTNGGSSYVKHKKQSSATGGTGERENSFYRIRNTNTSNSRYALIRELFIYPAVKPKFSPFI